MNDSTVSEPKAYRSQVAAEKFVKLYLAGDDEFEEMRSKGEVPEGISRITASEINWRFDMDDSLGGAHLITLLDNVEITGIISISNHDKELMPLYCYNSKTGSINFYDSKLSGIGEFVNFAVEIHDSLVKDLFINSSSIGEISIRNSSVRSIYITGSSIKRLGIRTNSSIGSFSISNNSYLGSFYIYDHSTSGKIYVSDNCETGDWIISNDCKLEGIDVRDKCSTGKLFIFNSEIREFSVLHSSCSFLLESSQIPLLKLSNCRIISFKITAACKIEGYFSDCDIALLDFRKMTLSHDTLLSFSNTSIYALLMEEFVVMGNLHFRQIKTLTNFEEENLNVEQKEVKSGIMQGYVPKNDNQQRAFDDVQEQLTEKEKITEPIIRIAQSSLGRTEFTACPLAKFRFQYTNSKITECFIMGGSVPEKNIEILDAEDDPIEIHLQKASFYNQFKKIFEAQGDIYRATQFQAKWAKHQQEYLTLKRKLEKEHKSFLQRLAIYTNETSQDIYTLWLNKISNNHGESWARALILILAATLFFYTFYLLSLGISFHRNNFDSNLIGYYFEFLNPAHKINFLNDTEKPNGLSIFIDFTARLFNAYLIYQFITAFRKHGKK